MARANGLPIDDSAIIDAYVWALDKHRQNSNRRFRLLVDDDIPTLYMVRAELGRRWAPVKFGRNIAYYDWRHAELDTMQREFDWSTETRDLYGSMISILWSWNQYGKSLEAQERLKVLYPGTSLLLQFLTRFQPQLTIGGEHEAHAL